MATKRNGIAAAGNWIVDRVKIVDAYPVEESLAHIHSETIGNGGCAFSVLVDLAKLGAPFPLEGIGVVGDDDEGRWILDVCMDNGIEAGQIVAARGESTSYTDVMSVRSTGKRTFFHHIGANAKLGPGHFDFGATRSKMLHLGYLLLLDGLDQPDEEFGTVSARVLSEAQKAGIETSIDVVSAASGKFREAVLPALKHVDYIFMNEHEAAQTTEIPTRAGKDLAKDNLRRAGLLLLQTGSPKAVFLHAPEGALGLGQDGFYFWQPSVNLAETKVVGSVGAGDAFAAGTLLGLHENMGLEDCLRIGVCAAAASLLSASASEGMLPLAECLALGEKFGYGA